MRLESNRMTISVLFLGIIVLAVLVPLCVGLIVAFVKGGPTVRWILGAFLGCLLLGFVGLVGMITPHDVVHRPVPVRPSSVTIAAAEQAAFMHSVIDPVLWQGNLEEELTPDVYSSLKAAACGLGLRLHETIRTASGASPEKIVLLEDSSNVDIVYLEDVRRGLKTGFLETDIAIIQTPSGFPSPTEGQLWISVSMQDEKTFPIHLNELDMGGGSIHMEQTFDTGNTSGTLKAVVRTAQNAYVEQVTFDCRSWLFEPDKFRAAVGFGRWAVIASNQTALTRQEALQQAMQTAQNYLAEQLGSSASTFAGFSLQDGGFIVDEYTQRLQGLSGPIWRAAILLDVRPERMQFLRRSVILVQQHRKHTWLNLAASLVGMMALVSLLYACINTLTKGYYAFPLAMISIVAIGIFLVFFLMLS